MIHPNLYNTDIVDSKIRINFSETYKTFNIQWDPIPGATGYSVYAGFDPFHIKALISGAEPLTTTSFSFEHKPLISTKMVYFWVKYYTDANPSGTFLYQKGMTIYDSLVNGLLDDPNRFPDDIKALTCDYDSKFMIEEFRRRIKTVLYDSGEEVQLFLRQWHGLPSKSASGSMGLYPDYQGMTRDDSSYGTGFYPGYFPAINIMVRFNNNNSLSINYQENGLKLDQQYAAFTLWELILNTMDVIYRPSTGDKYVISDIMQTNYRAVVNVQRFNVKLVEPTSPLYSLKNEDLITKWQNINQMDFLRIGFNVMVSDPALLSKYYVFE